jgi:hypothetical protein
VLSKPLADSFAVGRRQKLINIGDAMVFFTLETGIFGLISEGHIMVGVRITESERKTLLENILSLDFWGANPNFMDKIFEARKKFPVSENVKKTVFIR